MATCEEIIASALGEIANAWACRPLGDGRLLVTTSRQYSDGDHVEMLIRQADGEIVISDGGQTLTRLDAAGVNISSGRAQKAWLSLIQAHQLEVHDGRVLMRGPISEAGVLAESMTNALANLDGLRLMAAPYSTPSFPERLVTFLQAEFEFVDDRPVLRGQSGSTYRLTAAAGDPERPVYIQAVAGANAQIRRRAIEHAFFLFFDVDGTLGARQKLIVLGGEVDADWLAGPILVASRVAYIGSWGSRERFVKFISGQIEPPKDRLLLSGHEQLVLRHD